MARPGTLPRHDLGLDALLEADDAVPHPAGRITLVEGESYAPFDLSAAGFRSLRPLIGCGKVGYLGIRDDHHVFTHPTGDRYEPVWRLRAPGPRGPFPATPLHLGCGGLLATFTDQDHVWVSTLPAGLAVGASEVSFSFHHHRAADGRWIPSAWDPAHVRPVGGFLTLAPLGSLRDIAEVVLPAIAAGLAELPATGPPGPVREARPPGRATGPTGGRRGEPGGREPTQNPLLVCVSAISRWLVTVIVVLPLAALLGSLILFAVFELIVLVDVPPHLVVGGGALVAAGLAGPRRGLALGRRLARGRPPHRPGATFPSAWLRRRFRPMSRPLSVAPSPAIPDRIRLLEM